MPSSFGAREEKRRLPVCIYKSIHLCCVCWKRSVLKMRRRWCRNRCRFIPVCSRTSRQQHVFSSWIVYEFFWDSSVWSVEYLPIHGYLTGFRSVGDVLNDMFWFSMANRTKLDCSVFFSITDRSCAFSLTVFLTEMWCLFCHRSETYSTTLPCSACWNTSWAYRVSLPIIQLAAIHDG